MAPPSAQLATVRAATMPPPPPRALRRRRRPFKTCVIAQAEAGVSARHGGTKPLHGDRGWRGQNSRRFHVAIPGFSCCCWLPEPCANWRDPACAREFTPHHGAVAASAGRWCLVAPQAKGSACARGAISQHNAGVLALPPLQAPRDYAPRCPPRRRALLRTRGHSNVPLLVNAAVVCRDRSHHERACLPANEGPNTRRHHDGVIYRAMPARWQVGAAVCTHQLPPQPRT